MARAMDPVPEQEIEDLAATTGHTSFLAFARWLRRNREDLASTIRERSDAQDRVLADLTREMREVKQTGLETKEQAQKTNGRVTDLEMKDRIKRALEEQSAEREASHSDWAKVGAGAFIGSMTIGLVDLIVHFAGG